jgi:hypothetical protein
LCPAFFRQQKSCAANDENLYGKGSCKTGFHGSNYWFSRAEAPDKDHDGLKPPIKLVHILVAVNRINTLDTGKSTISNVPPMALIWAARILVSG